MPCILKVRIVAARDLPVMDRATELTDAFVEIKFADYDEYRTQICRRTLNPVWNEDFRFEVSNDADLQNEPLELKIMDYDQITYNDSIGTVFIDLNPLLTWDSTSQISGWIPIFDTLRGVRGELSVQVRLQFFGDINPFKDSSAGVQFHTMTAIPPGLSVASVLGFVNALEVEDDPEYHWSDNFRTPRTSNESRMRVMYRLSGQLRRQLGKKVLEMGGNAVVGYKQYYDIESEERTISARAIGTAVRLALPDQKLEHGQSWSSLQTPVASPMATPFSEHFPSISPAAPGIAAASKGRTGDSPENSDIEDGREDQPSAPGLIALTGIGYKTPEFILITLHSFPPGAVLGLGGLVSATSVKIIDSDERFIREAWWAELRDEIKSHARSVGCPFVIGYSESTTILDNLVVLHCSGTAAIMDFTVLSGPISRMNSLYAHPSPSLEDTNKNTQPSLTRRGSMSGSTFRETFMNAVMKRKRRRASTQGCQVCHITYHRHESPFPMSYARCALCRKKYVPEVLLTTVDPPPELDTIGNGILIEAHVSESIPFAQYDIHRQLLYKLRIHGLNAVFGLKIQFSVGEGLMTAVATGTAMYVRALPPPPAMKVFRNLDVVDEEDKNLLEIQRGIMQRSENNRRAIEQALVALEEDTPRSTAATDTDGKSVKSESDSGSDSESDSEDEKEAVPVTHRQRSVVVQIDDEQDEDLVLSQDPTFPDGFQICNTDLPPISDTLFKPHTAYTIQTVTLIKHATISPVSHHPNHQLADVFRNLYQEVQFQLSYFKPCVLAGLKYDVQVVKDNEVQIAASAVALGQFQKDSGDTFGILSPSDSVAALSPLSSKPDAPVREPTSLSIFSRFSKTTVDDEIVFPFDDDDEADNDASTTANIPRAPTASYSEATDSPFRQRNDSIASTPATEILDPTSVPTMAVEVTPLWYVPSTRVDRFLGRISLHFVKEAGMVFETASGMSGMGGFTHTFLVELYAVLRAHAAALGGNALVAFTIDQVVIQESLKNQAYALVSVSGDVLDLTFTDPNLRMSSGCGMSSIVGS
ncbi:hypothetical protein BC832DRAFT_610651 [Gaertneriomyces semiglobifer]|nr:hypothetical protein BC832DRAFT_610651 [Gaertneriomyces semiglobifer]